MRLMKSALLLWSAACIPITFPPTAFADGQQGRTTTMSEYRVEYKLRNPKTGAMGESHVTYVRAESESNVLAKLRQENTGKDVVILSLVRK